MKCRTTHLILILICSLITCSFADLTSASAQVNIGALAQFKQNQQAELAKQLQGSAMAEAKVEKGRKHGKGQAEAPMVVAKPPVIKAQTRTFKGNYSDLRKPNMR